MKAPTKQQFEKYQKLFDYFNRTIFNNELPQCLLILSNRKSAAGHFISKRWSDRKGNRTDEISINPQHLSVATESKVCQTLVHEMVHLWQFEFGNPSRKSYHNTEWANKMESIGLAPSSTGSPGGNRTGQKMRHYPIPGGEFMKAYKAMPKSLRLPLKPQLLINFGAKSNRKTKTKYSCSCGNNVWGKSGLKIICSDCQHFFRVH